tara:strand:- start:1780 stop:2436 length:657 start_codon:yes stop_codon:yes gene_type:complete
LKKIRIQLSSLVGRWVFQILFLFNKVVIHGEKNLLDLAEQGNPVMVCVWHGRLIFPSWYIRLKLTNLYAIASHHDDAEIMARILDKWGYGLIRGSTKKGGKAVVLKMAEVFQDGGIIAVTNDGPKGPAQIAKAGSTSLAIKYNVKIITITGSATKYWQINSWDKFLLPKPFGRIEIIISPPLEVDSKSITAEEEVNILSTFMTDYQNLVDIKTGKIKE